MRNEFSTIFKMTENKRRNKFAGGEPDAKPPILSMPSEVLVAIFGHLDATDNRNVAKVCVSWSSLVTKPSLWSNVQLKYENEVTLSDPLVAKSLSVRGIRHVTMPNFEVTQLPALIRSVPNLQSLRLRRQPGLGTENWRAVVYLLKQLPRLTELTLDESMDVTDAGVEQLARGLANLRSLDLTGCGLLSGAALTAISTGLLRLKRLGPVYCGWATDRNFRDFVGWTRPAGTYPLLEHLDLFGCQNLTDRSLFCLSVAQRCLRTLRLTYFSGMTDNGLRHLATLTELRQLRLEMCCSVTDSGMAHLAAVASLRRLELRGSLVGDEGLARLSQPGSVIEQLELRVCAEVTDEGLRHLSRMASLRTLILSACAGVTAEGLRRLGDGVASINQLQLWDCPGVGPDGLSAIAGCHPRLRILRLDDKYVCEEGLLAAARNLRDLRALYTCQDDDGDNRIGEIHRMWRDC